MNNELTAYAESLSRRFELITAAVDGLDAAQLNWRPPFVGANSVWVLATHTAGNARAWILGIACGLDVGRDRPAEFASSGGDAPQIIASIERTIADVEAALRDLDPARLDARLVPPQELWGEGPPHEISVRDAISRVITPASLHLGHMHVTRDLALAQKPKPYR